ncbi:lipopolysaccharide heptosyltransferase I [Candidatus Rickettsiella viridis]|uniref:Lipopolysaccharide heptosyltransferase 1 n=1 Tax=Candidatus Rickettsiella viridis TaxID=676208 RepID=A0A2Z5UXJ7_9COXI|nr:lipopolysaccharide heptosyltransferase I [Candidatus Rickettsiella viridis]BBB15810.1 lipopolysaccharide heptosyltransferase I [Candidatus Rickettsiella viridis]
MHVLIVKMSSMGDIIHTLPAINDANTALPGIQFDWVTEEAFTEIPMWHKNVKQVIPIALRRWRKQIYQSLREHEVQQFYKQLRRQHYDKVLDAQGSIKSAVTTRLSRGYRVGFDKNSVRELFANLAYQKTFSVPWKQHAIARSRQLFAKAFGYTLANTPPCYGIDKTHLHLTKFTLPENYLVFVPNASWSAKCWPETSWYSLAEKTAQEKIPVFIPWGNEEEKKRASRIRNKHSNVTVLPALSLTELASVVLHAKAAVCVDTGLSHLAAALEVPSITLYGPTDPQFIGTMGTSQIHQPLDASVETIWQLLQTILN